MTISKGADGKIEPFSKRYDDPEVAVRTQFSLAEAYLEMAKRHRKLGETELARQEFAAAKQLLTSSLDQFHDPETRSHAEYLLGNSTLEEALCARETKDTRFRAACPLRMTGTYPDASSRPVRVAHIYEAPGNLTSPRRNTSNWPTNIWINFSTLRRTRTPFSSCHMKPKPNPLASGEVGDKDD